MKSFRVLLFCLLLIAVGLAEGTRTWQQTKYDEFEKGTPRGVAINSDGSLSLAPSFSVLSTSPSAYLWDLASDAAGNIYAAAGSPARVYKITPDGKDSVIFAPQELQVQALAIDSNGAIYAATSPDGKVYKIVHGGPAAGKAAGSAATQESSKSGRLGENSRSAVAVDPSYSASLYFDPKTKYIWTLALDKQGRLYIGTGDRGEIFRVDSNGNGSVFFKSDEAQIRVLDFDNLGNLIAGTDGNGLIYRISPQGEGFVLFSAPKKEITALAIDAQGNVFAAGAGDKRSAGPQLQPGAPSGPASSAPTPTIIVQSGSAQAQGTAPGITPIPFPNVMNLGGSDVYRISTDGSPKTIWSSKEDLVYALAFDPAGRLLAGTGNRGKIYAIRGNDYTDLYKASANQVTAFARAPKGGLYAATSNLGKVLLLGPEPVAEGTYESDVFDARIFSKWGRAEVRGTGSFEIFARSGNVDNPDRNWSHWTKVDLAKELPVDAPPARFVQWKAVLHSGSPAPVVDDVTLNYLSKNVAPEVDDVTVMVGARVPSTTHTSNTTSESAAYESPVPTVPDKHSIAVKWKARDANDDQVLYSVYYRGDGESQWKLLRDGIEDRYVDLEADLFPDGGYTIRIVATDAPSHSLNDALTGEETSSRFEVDNSPPRVEFTNTRIEGGQLHLVFRATDSFSPISRAEYSIDADDWQTAEPVGQISDYKVENYDLTVPLPAPAPGKQAVDEHTIVVRVFDRFENVGVAKTVIKSTPAASH
ncbi:MAG TPA: two-component regulator propeller domain-containing protein [Terriglobales bacterium]